MARWKTVRKPCQDRRGAVGEVGLTKETAIVRIAGPGRV
jgi:hypothetical protein